MTSPDGATFHLVATHRALCCLSCAHSFGNLINDMQTLYHDSRYHTPCHISSVPLHARTALPHRGWACQQEVRHCSVYERQQNGVNHGIHIVSGVAVTLRTLTLRLRGWSSKNNSVVASL
jgi:hypothetical protein